MIFANIWSSQISALYCILLKEYSVFRSISIQVVILLIVFNVFSFIRESNMMSNNDFEKQAPHQLPTLMADNITLAATGKTTVIYFFAPWCSVCHISIENLQQQFLNNQNIDVIAVALDYQNIEEVAQFSKQHQLTFPIALGNSKIKADFKVKGYPSYYVLDKNNIIVAKSLGYSTELGLYLRTL